MSDAVKFVEQLVQETSPADDFPRLEMQEGGAIKGSPRLPVTAEQQELAQKLYGKDFKDLSVNQRTKLRAGRIKTDPVTFQEYLNDYKKMAADPDYKPKFIKPMKGEGLSPQQLRARQEAKRTVEGFDSKFQKNVSRRKRIKMKATIEADPERKQKEMAKKAERRRQRRTAKLSDKVALTQREKLLNFEQSLITRQLNDKIKANPDIILKNKKLLDKLSTTVDSDGNIIKSKPTIYELEKRGLFEIEHQRDVRKAGAMKDFPYNRNLILGPYNRSGGFKDMAEKFIEKNPDPKNPKIKNIIKKAEELKVTLQPNVPKGSFKTKGLGYKQPANPTGKFVTYAKSYLPELVDDNIGLKGYTKNREMLEKGLKATRKVAQSSGPTLGMNLGFGTGLKTLGEVAGSPAAALALATMTVRDNLRKGESLPVAVADKMVGAELLLPGVTSRFAPGVLKSITGLGRAARLFTPVGLGITAAGVVKDVVRESKRRAALSDEERLKEDLEAQEKFDEMMVGAAKGGLIPPKSGKTPHGDKGLASLADYDMTNTEFINGRY
jgi:hypothetical protein